MDIQEKSFIEIILFNPKWNYFGGWYYFHSYANEEMRIKVFEPMVKNNSLQMVE